MLRYCRLILRFSYYIMLNKPLTHLLQSKQYLRWIIPLVLVVFIKFTTAFPAFIETYYSYGVYPFFANCQRTLWGWLPFSIGDLLYCLFVFFLLYRCYCTIQLARAKKINWEWLKTILLRNFRVLLWVYIIFQSFWAINYHRQGIAHQLQLTENHYTEEELKTFVCDLVDELNTTRTALGDSNFVYPNNGIIFNNVYDAYQVLHYKIPFLHYQHPSVKPSLFSYIVSYAGYSGYYNPFTGEAQVNTDLPGFCKPDVTCHEMAHQLGYASESEASFVGYLAGINSSNLMLKYSTLFNLFATANSELFAIDFWAAILNIKDLNPLVRRDRRIYRNYILGNQNNIEPVLKNVYDQYLKANAQKRGINSYEDVVGWVIAYRKKYGTR